MSLLVLPELHSLISSRHSFHVKCACKVVKLILKSFGPVIKTNMATPPVHGGVDITREER
jgi:katanin p80 WD40 repeat-containing subunit B1